jgi:hypothetical protein
LRIDLNPFFFNRNQLFDKLIIIFLSVDSVDNFCYHDNLVWCRICAVLILLASVFCGSGAVVIW